jgi:hypothetical protein
LAVLAEHEIADRDRRLIERHLAEARLPVGKTLASFDFDAVEAPDRDCGGPLGQMFEKLFNRSHYPPDRLHYRELPIFFVVAELLHLAQILFEAFWVNDLFIPFAMVEPAQPDTNSSRSAHFAVHELIASDFRNIYRDLRMSR